MTPKALAARLRELVADAPEPAEITFDLEDANDIADLREIISALEGVEEMREALTKIAIGVSPSASMEVTDKVPNTTDHYNSRRVSIRDFARAALKEKP